MKAWLKEYGLNSIDAKREYITDTQKNEVEKYWNKISYAYKINTDWCKLYTYKTGHFSEKYIPNELHYCFT